MFLSPKGQYLTGIWDIDLHSLGMLPFSEAVQPFRRKTIRSEKIIPKKQASVLISTRELSTCSKEIDLHKVFL